MSSKVVEIVNMPVLVEKIQRRLPHLFFYAERESSRAGSVGMEVGSVRERILITLLIYTFGKENVETNIYIKGWECNIRERFW